jgi:hypothetical protein
MRRGSEVIGVVSARADVCQKLFETGSVKVKACKRSSTALHSGLAAVAHN